MYVRALSPAEQAGVEAGLRSSNAFTLRRSQILLASSRGQRPSEIARNLGCATQTVRNTLHAFEQRGLGCLKQESSRPKTIHAEFDQPKCEALRALLHQRPRTYGKNTSVWTLALAAQVCQELGLTSHQVSIETIRLALKRLGVGWQRAKHWITSPDPDYSRKKTRRDALIALAQRMGWAVGYLDEVWWSRVAQPAMSAWSEVKQPLRLVELQVSKDDPDPKALSCYGMLDASSGQIRLRFVDGRPVSQVTTDFLEWLCQQVAAQGQRTLVLIWDNASWHESQARAYLDPATESGCIAGGARGETRRSSDPLLVANEESLAQPHRAPLGAWQTGDCRTGSFTHRSRGHPAGVRPFWL